MARLAGMLLSLLLHTTLLGAGVWLFENTSPPGAAQPVELVELKLTAPPAPQEQPQQQLTRSQKRKRKIFDVLADAKLPHENFKPVKLISPHKVDVPEGDVRLGKTDIFFGTGYLKQGNEVRLTLRGLRAAEFGVQDFLGSYKLQGEDGELEIRQLENGRLLFIDHESGLRRLLHKKGKFIYTYGPEYDVAEPVSGSLTFLPHERRAIDLPSRIMWLPEKPPMKIGAMTDWPELTEEEGSL